MNDVKIVADRKREALEAAYEHREGPYVPSAIDASVPTIAWTGKRATEIIHDPESFISALTAIFEEMWCDGVVCLGATFTPRKTEAFGTVQNKFGPDGITPEHVQLVYMNENEYEELSKAPDRFIANVLLPRKYPWLFDDKERAKNALKVFAEDNFYCLIQLLSGTMLVMNERYGIQPMVDMMKSFTVPIDKIFDDFRGFQGTIIDIRRRPEQVHAAMDRIWEEWCVPSMGKVSPRPYAVSFPHIAAYLRPKQFDEFYWPHQKAFITHFAEQGCKSWIMLEGSWANIWDHFNDLPKDSVIAHVDDDDIVRAKKEIGENQIIEGGVRISDLRCNDFDSLKGRIAATLDECAAGGGFIFCPDKSLIAPGDVGQNTVECYNFVHEYTSR